jgi:hypothetical protein
VIQQPASPVRSLTGLQICADKSGLAHSAPRANAAENEKGLFIMESQTVSDGPL